MSSRPTRRRFITGAAAGVFAPAIMRASRVEAATVEAMAGQLLVIGLPGSSPDDASAKALAAHIAAGRAGGMLALRHNVKSRSNLSAMASLMLAGRSDALMAIDQEGGKVQRLGSKMGFTNIPTAQWVAGNLSVDDARALYEKAGREMRSVGFNLNLAPSLDIHQPDNPVIGKYGRSYGTDPERIVQYGGAFIAGMGRAGVACAAKHFPGHGSSRSDSHDGFVDVSASWNATELEPFRALAKTAPVIMGGHLYQKDFSNGHEPITFSPKALKTVLRGKLGYRGVIITDDLDMGAIRKNYALKEACVKALEAGNDLLLLSNSLKYDPDLPAQAVGWISGAVRQGRLSQSDIQAAYNRVMAVRSRARF